MDAEQFIAEGLEKVRSLLEAKRLFQEAKDGGFNGAYIGPLVSSDAHFLDTFEKNRDEIGYVNGGRFALLQARSNLTKLGVSSSAAGISGRGEGLMLERIQRETTY